jgi:DNA-binding NtrC family response regulator
MTRVLVVDDEPKLGRMVQEMLELDGHAVVRAGDGSRAIALLGEAPFDVVVTDLRMPGADGIAVLRAARARPGPPGVIVVTAYGSAASAVEAMKAGAADYLTKPFSMDELRLRVKRLAAERGTEQERARLVDRLTPDLVAESAAMSATLSAARRVAASDVTVLLLGESGTGKSRLARFIHYQSRRAAAPLVEVHCAALPDALLEGELFGHERGAFTGATQRRPGHLAAADGGTLFLDEIGEITPATQVKLLRFLQDRTFVPLGATAEQSVDVRAVAATNADLEAAVRAGRFREDLWYRLDVFAIRVPPLRERRDDVLPLALRHLAGRGVPAEALTQGARDRLLAHAWPGNVRELENVLERAVILAGDGPIEPAHVLPARPGPPRSSRVGDLLGDGFALDDLERELIREALARAAGNKAAAARLLGVSRRRLYSLNATHGLDAGRIGGPGGDQGA